MVWPATDKLLVAALVATPLLRLTGLPKFVPSIWNCTVPVSVPLPWPPAATVAVKVTAWPDTEGLDEETTTVLVLALATVWVIADEALLAKLPSPL